jgi:plastocyanin
MALWVHEFFYAALGAATVVNDLVFTATYDGTIWALNKKSGEVVWSYKAPAGINAWPAVVGDTIIWPAGAVNTIAVNQFGTPQLIALKLGAAVPTATPTPTITPSPTVTQTPTPSPSPAPSPTAASPTPGGSPAAGAVTVNLIADNFAFDTNTVTVPAGAQVTLNFTNRDPNIPHNFAAYTDSSAATPIFVGQVINGVSSTRYTFTAPSTPGTYFFRCDVHPTTMTGQFIVQ